MKEHRTWCSKGSHSLFLNVPSLQEAYLRKDAVKGTFKMNLHCSKHHIKAIKSYLLVRPGILETSTYGRVAFQGFLWCLYSVIPCSSQHLFIHCVFTPNNKGESAVALPTMPCDQLSWRNCDNGTGTFRHSGIPSFEIFRLRTWTGHGPDMDNPPYSALEVPRSRQPTTVAVAGIPASRGHSHSCWLPRERARNLWHPG